MSAPAYPDADALQHANRSLRTSAGNENGMPFMTDSVEEVFTPAQKREITNLVAEAMISLESEAIPSVTWLHIMQAVRSANRRPRHKWRRAGYRNNSA